MRCNSESSTKISALYGKHKRLYFAAGLQRRIFAKRQAALCRRKSNHRVFASGPFFLRLSRHREEWPVGPNSQEWGVIRYSHRRVRRAVTADAASSLTAIYASILTPAAPSQRGMGWTLGVALEAGTVDVEWSLNGGSAWTKAVRKQNTNGWQLTWTYNFDSYHDNY